MCGIAGVINWRAHLAEEDLVGKMCRAMSHRGPDASGTRAISLADCAAALGHVRLSIIDLSDAAKQPMTNEDGSIWLIYNGEIYNFRELREELIGKGHNFISKTDSEVIIHLYEEKGKDCVGELRGIFAFALWDSKKKLLFAARDHFGVKPFYYRIDKVGSRILFASEIKGILEDHTYTKRVDMSSLDNYLRYQYIPADNTIFEGIKKLAPGHRIIADDRGLAVERYWNIKYEPKTVSGEEETLPRFKELFERTVKSQLISDVPIGAFLSGGADSTAVVYAMARSCARPVETFSIGFEEEDKNICELRWAKEVSGILGTNHHEIRVTLKDIFSLFPKIIYQLDEPIADPACFPTFLLSEFAKKKVTVVLTGEGGDELFAGYPLYAHIKSCLDEEKRLGILPISAKKAYIKVMSNFNGNTRSIKKWFMKTCGKKIEEIYPGLLKIFSYEERQCLYSKDIGKDIAMKDTEAILSDTFGKTDAVSALDKMLFVDTVMSMPEALLMKIDKMTMLNSLEARVPFLDPLLAGFIATLPENMKVRGTTGKYLLKRYLAGTFPERIFNRPKQGLILPLARWLKTEDKIWKEMVFDASSAGGLFFNREYIESLWRDFQNGNTGRANQLWTLAVFNMWYNLYLS